MSPLSIAFMALSWTLVLGLTTWSFSRVLRAQRRRTDRPPSSPEA